MMPQDDTKTIIDSDADASLGARLDARGEADYRAGCVVPHSKVAAWLKSWATPTPLPRPTSKPG